MTLLQLDNFCIRRGDFVLASGINLTLNAGQICHLIGANGSGKTTLMMQLAGLLPVSSLHDCLVDIDSFDDLNNLDNTDSLDDWQTLDDKDSNTDIKANHKPPTLSLPKQAPVYISHQLGIH